MVIVDFGSEASAASSESRREAASFICPSLLWPPRGPQHGFELSRLREKGDAYIPLEVSLALRQQQPEALCYRFFLVVAHVRPDSLEALPGVVASLRNFGWRVRDAQSLDAAGQTGKSILLLLQSEIDASRADMESALRRIPNYGVDLIMHPAAADVDHWRRTYVEAIRRFPWFFQARPCFVFIPSVSESREQEITKRFLLHNFAVKGVGRSSSATHACRDALFKLVGVGMIPAQDEVISEPIAPLPGQLPALAPVSSVASPRASLASVTSMPGIASSITSPRSRGAAPIATSATSPRSLGAPPSVTQGAGISPAVFPSDLPTKSKVDTSPTQKKPLPASHFEPATVTNLNLPSGTRVFADLKSFRNANLIEPADFPSGKEQVETSVLIVFGDACALGLPDVVRELLLANGFFILLERYRKVCPSELMLLLGLQANLQIGFRQDQPGGHQMHLSGLHPSLQTWLEHLSAMKHHFFIVRRSNAVSQLLQICFGPSESRTKSTPRVEQWPFLDIDDTARPRPFPLFLSLHHMISNHLITSNSETSVNGGVVALGPLACGVRRPVTPLLCTTCHSALHASSVVSALFPEMLGSEEIVAVLPTTPDRKQQLTLEILNSNLAGAPINCTLLRSTGETSVPLSNDTLVQKPGLRQVELIAKESVRSSNGPWGDFAWATLVVRVAIGKEIHAFARLRDRLSATGGSSSAIVACPLFEKYNGLVKLGAILVSGPYQVDMLVRDLWPSASSLASDKGELTADFAARCVRLTDPCFGVGFALKVFPGNFLRQSLSVWEPGSLQWCSEGSTSHSAQVQVEQITIQIKVDLEQRKIEGSHQQPSETMAAYPLFASMSEIVKEALRKIALESLVNLRRPRAKPLRLAALVFPRCAAYLEPFWGMVWMRDGTPWQTLGAYPEIYTAETFPVVVVLKPPDIARIQLDGLIVRDDAGGEKVRRGWRVRAGGDLPAQISDDRLASAFAELAWGPVHRDVAVIFETPGLHEPTVSVPAVQALGNSSASLHAVLRDRAVPESLVVPRTRHAAMEGLLLGATIARLAISIEQQPFSESDLRQALLHASASIVGLSEELITMLRNDYETMPVGWLCPMHGQKTQQVRFAEETGQSRTLCNESAVAVAKVWRAFLEPLDASAENILQTLLASDCFGQMIAGQPSTFISLDAPPTSSDVLVHFMSDERGAHPDTAVWNVLPVFGKPGRLAAQLYVMLRVDSQLPKFPEVNKALIDGFMQTYTQEAPHMVGTGPSILRLRLHVILCILELDIWMSRTMEPWSAGQNATALRDFFREEVNLGHSSFRKAVGI